MQGKPLVLTRRLCYDPFIIPRHGRPAGIPLKGYRNSNITSADTARQFRQTCALYLTGFYGARATATILL